MKTLKIIITISFVTLIAMPSANAQIFRKLGKKVEKAVERGVENGVERTVERKVRKKTEEKTGEVIDGVINSKKKNKKKTETDSSKAVTKDSISGISTIDESSLENRVKNVLMTGQIDNQSNTTSNCAELTTSEIEKALSLSQGSVENAHENPCGYVITLADGSKSPLSITRHEISKENAKKEIDTYKNDETGLLTAQKSVSGNSYLCLNKPNSWLIIYNTSVEYAIHLNFSTLVFSSFNKDLTVPTFETAKENTIKVANYYLKHK